MSLPDKAFPVSWDQFHRDARALAWRLADKGKWKAIVCVTRGGLVPAAIIWFGLSDATIFTVVLLGAVPSIINGLLAGMDQIPPIYLRAGQIMGAKGFGRTWRIVLPAAWPGYLAGLEQGWAFSWRSLMAAELIAVSPALGPGLGQMLDTGRSLGNMALILGAIAMIMAVGILIERLIFAPLRQRTLRNRGLIR